ncbi:MAG TPA: hypothetical protein VII52_12115 [Gemmatimonadaceae bacterium]
MLKRTLSAVLVLAAIGCGENSSPTSSRQHAASPFGSAGSRAVPTHRLRSIAPAASDVAIQVVDPATLTVGGSITFGAFGTDLSNHDGLLTVNGGTFAERFASQSLDAAGDFDVLSDGATVPLRLQAGAANQNLSTLFDAPSNSVVLAGVSAAGGGFPAFNAIGEGSIALLFDQDQFEVGMSVTGANGGAASVDFFRRDGSLIQTIVLQLADVAAPQAFAFRRVGDVRDIAGISIENDDPGGIGFVNFLIDTPTGSTQFVPANQPATVTVNANGQPIAGISFPANTFDHDITITASFVSLVGQTCHDYLLGQTGRCLHIATVPPNPILHQPAVVGVCLPAVQHADIFKFESAQDRPVALPETTPSFLNCNGFLGSVTPEHGMKGLAMGLAKRVGDWFSPTPLYAAHNGFGGLIGIDDGLSFFRWAAPIHISNAILAVNVLRSGKDVLAVAGTFDLTQPSFTAPTGLTGFDPARDAVIVGLGKSVSTIPVNSFKYSRALKRWVFAAQTSAGVTGMAINPVDGTFDIAATVSTEGTALPTYRAFSLQIGNRAQGEGLLCATSHLCVAQEP